MAENGQRLLDIDVTDEHAFRTGVVQHLQAISDRTYGLNEMKEKLDKHEAAYTAAKWAAIPIIGFISATLKHLLSKAGAP